jgi:hypothetical protein
LTLWGKYEKLHYIYFIRYHKRRAAIPIKNLKSSYSKSQSIQSFNKNFWSGVSAKKNVARFNQLEWDLILIYTNIQHLTHIVLYSTTLNTILSRSMPVSFLEYWFKISSSVLLHHRKDSIPHFGIHNSNFWKSKATGVSHLSSQL